VADTLTMTHKLPKVKLVADRNRFVREYCTGKTVLHLGCAEEGTTERSTAKGTHLHMQLVAAAKHVIGVDISQEALDALGARGVGNLIRWDVERLSELSLEGPIEVIVLGEVLEHLANPGLCLRGLASHMAAFNAACLITVPNAFSVRHFYSVALTQTELVWPDHTAYYSITTLSSLLDRYGLAVREMYMYSNVNTVESRMKRWAKICFNRTVLAVAPWIAEGIIAVVGRRPPPAHIV
jgi:2-polyprenyl-3-methyl-5-hydroxy-6-metoxy-1,4-benzoquinol methylase